MKILSMKVLHVSYSDSAGGAARAAYRLHRAQLAAGIHSRMMVRSKKTDDWTIIGPGKKLETLLNIFRFNVGQLINKLQKSRNKNFHSGNWLPSMWANRINCSDCDVVNLHWVAGETMSIEDIGRIKKPIIWTLHDMWAFCGSEHVTDCNVDARWRIGYYSNNRSSLAAGIDLDKWVWLRKKRAWIWGQPMNIVAPSHWMAECVRNSHIFKENTVTVIPNALNTDVFKPLEQHFCRQVLGLPEDKKIILFGAMGGGRDENKGYDLLLDALMDLSTKISNDDVLCLIFGQSEPKNLVTLPFQTRWLGHIYDDATLAILYNAATVMIVPSRCENLPQTATEAQSCGVPVVAFNCTGIIDVVEHMSTGYLARPYETDDLSSGITLILRDEKIRHEFGQNARNRALRLWSASNVVIQYQDLYQSCIKLR